MDSQQQQALLEQAFIGSANKLITCLTEREPNVQAKYDYYNADNDVRDYGISVPRKMIHNRPGVGWAGRAVNTVSDRVVFDGFANDSFGINEYWDGIKGQMIVNQDKHDAFIGGCAFVAISDNPVVGSKYPKILTPFTALEATGTIDQATGLLKYGLAVTRWQIDTNKKHRKVFGPRDYILFTPEYTVTFKDGTLYDIAENPTGRTLLHVISHRSTADRPLGKSRLTNVARRIIQEASRVKRRWEIAAEFYSTPQRYINGLAEGAEKDTSLDSALGKVWAINKDEDGDKPDIGQLTQMSIDQFSGMKKDLARDFCAETGLTLRNLGYETGNPTSAESLSAMSDDMLLESQNSQNEMGKQIKEIAITLRMAIDGNDQIPAGLSDIIPAWSPIFQRDIGAAGDAMFKLFEVMPELKGTMTAYQMLGIGVRDAERLMAARAKLQSTGFMNNSGGSQ